MSMSPFYRKMRVKETAHVEKLAVKVVSADTTLQPEDSGKVILMGSNGVDVTLPAATAGMYFKVIQTADYATAVCTVVASTGDFLSGGVASADADDGELFNGSSHLTATFSTGTLAGDQIELVSDGTVWFISGSMSEGGTTGIVAS